jgi:hypothetical protein
MNAAEIRSELLKKIDAMSITQLKEFYGLFQNYFFGNDILDEWDSMTAQQKAKIEKGIAQADHGNTKPLNEVTTRLRRKYKLNG